MGATKLNFTKVGDMFVSDNITVGSKGIVIVQMELTKNSDIIFERSIDVDTLGFVSLAGKRRQGGYIETIKGLDEGTVIRVKTETLPNNAGFISK